MQTKAAVLYAANSPLQVETLDLTPPRAGELRIRICAAGVCHSDLHVVSGQATHNLPVVLGHEGAGIVEEIGDGVKDFDIGDHVVLTWIPYCGTCFFCVREQNHLCRTYKDPLWQGTMLDGSCRMSKNGREIFQLSMLATWSEHIIVARQSCVKIPKPVPFEIAALLGCAVTTGIGAVINKACVQVGDTVAIIGVGGVGLSMIMGAVLAQADRIIAIDIRAEKEDLARQFGATDFILAGNKTVYEVCQLTQGIGADHVFEAVGQVSLQEMGLKMARAGGRLTFVGMAGNNEKISVSAANITRDEITICGSIFGSARTDTNLNRYADLYLHGQLPLDRLVTRRYPLSGINQALADMNNGLPGRGVIVF